MSLKDEKQAGKQQNRDQGAGQLEGRGDTRNHRAGEKCHDTSMSTLTPTRKRFISRSHTALISCSLLTREAGGRTSRYMNHDTHVPPPAVCRPRLLVFCPLDRQMAGCKADLAVCGVDGHDQLDGQFVEVPQQSHSFAAQRD